MMKKIVILVCIFVFLGAGSALAATPKKGGTPAAEPKKEAVAKPKKGGTLVYGRGGDSVGLDPAYETDGNSFMICDNIFEALVFYKDESTALEPGLATS
ncbi:MAG: hypothetical protein L6300_04355, partial [Syntrophaceae bacterium]|nr:hypothetical protein [Syntrophaceae bacterium]